MAAFKSIFVLLLIAFSFVAVNAVDRVEACDEVCDRIDREKDSCCKAHHYTGWYTCNGGMYCY